MAKRESCLSEKQKEPFERCYAVWRKDRRDRGESERAWMDINPEPDRAEDIFQRILAWNIYWRSEGTQSRYIKWFSRWLKKCTRDDIPSQQGSDRTVEGEITCIQCTNHVYRKFTLCKVCEDKYTAESKAMADQFCKELGLENKEAMRKWARSTLKAKFNTMRVK